jgi:hypothetical protein
LAPVLSKIRNKDCVCWMGTIAFIRSHAGYRNHRASNQLDHVGTSNEKTQAA